MDAYVELIQEIVNVAAARAISEVASEGALALHRARRLFAEDPMAVNGMYYDDEWVEFCLFDDDAHGFDDEEAGFGP